MGCYRIYYLVHTKDKRKRICFRRLLIPCKLSGYVSPVSRVVKYIYIYMYYTTEWLYYTFYLRLQYLLYKTRPESTCFLLWFPGIIYIVLNYCTCTKPNNLQEHTCFNHILKTRTRTFITFGLHIWVSTIILIPYIYYIYMYVLYRVEFNIIFVWLFSNFYNLKIQSTNFHLIW